MYAKSPLVRWAFWLSLVLLAATTALPIVRILPLAQASPFIALHYNIYLGVDRFGSLWHIFFIPLLGLLFLVVHLTAQAAFFRPQKTLALFFAAATPLLQFILLVAMTLIVLINL